MDIVLRAAFVYIFLYSLLRLSGRRTLAEITPFDLVLLLIIGEAISQGIMDDDFSLMNSAVLIISLLVIDIVLSELKGHLPGFRKIMDGVPMVVVDHGHVLTQRIRTARLSEEDILESARQTQGIESMEQIKYAVLETNGSISIIPLKDKSA